MFPTSRRIRLLQMKHWESRITLAQANALRTCLWSLEDHLWNKVADTAIETVRENEPDRLLPVKQKSRYSKAKEDDGREVAQVTDAFGRSHTYHL